MEGLARHSALRGHNAGMQPTGSLTSFRDSSDTSPSPRLFPRGFPPGCGPYPAGKGSNSIRRSMAPNSRHVRWLSARSSQ
jgi:hypothetical protein